MLTMTVVLKVLILVVGVRALIVHGTTIGGVRCSFNEGFCQTTGYHDTPTIGHPKTVESRLKEKDWMREFKGCVRT